MAPGSHGGRYKSSAARAGYEKPLSNLELSGIRDAVQTCHVIGIHSIGLPDAVNGLPGLHRMVYAPGWSTAGQQQRQQQNQPEPNLRGVAQANNNMRPANLFMAPKSHLQSKFHRLDKKVR
jgi:hypothetical protein